MLTLRLFKISLCCILLLSCNAKEGKANTASDTQKESSTLSRNDIKNIKFNEFALDVKVKKLASLWSAYFVAENIIKEVRVADFNFFINNDGLAIPELMGDIRSTIPRIFKTQGIRSRLTIFEGALYKTDAAVKLNSNSKTELLDAVEELFIAFSNLNFQLNKKVEKDAQNIERPI
jgi:hypothetical protein